MKDVWRTIALPLGLIVVFILAIIGIFNVSKSFSTPPKLVLNTPTTVSTTSDKVVISGQADPNAIVKVGKTTVKVDKSGGFSYTLSVNEGVNKVNVTAQKSLSLVANQQTVTVTKTTAVVATPANPSVATGQTGALTTSGPVDSLIGSLGLASLLISIYVYFRSSRMKQERKYNYNLFT